MGIKDIFQKKKKKSKVEEINYNNIFRQSSLQIDIGRWLGAIRKPSDMSYYEWDALIEGRLEGLVEQGVISAENLNNIPKKFAKILEVAVNGKKIVSLRNYSKDNSTFTCELDDGSTKNMQFFFGAIDDGPELIVKDEKKTVTYDFYLDHKDIPAHLELQEIERYLDNGIVFNHLNSPYSYFGYLYDGKKMIEVSIKYKDEKNGAELINKGIMEQSITNLSLDASINDICQAIVKGIKGDPKNVGTISISKKLREKSKYDGKVIEKIVFENGQIREMVFVRSGHVIEVTDFSSWNYKTDNGYAVSHSNKGDVFALTYELKKDEELDQPIIPRQYIESAMKEVDETKKLSLSLLNKENK